MAIVSGSSILQKVWRLLTPAEHRSALILLCLMIVGMVLETLGVGLVLPATMLLSQSDTLSRYPALQPVLQSLGNPGQTTLVIGGMLILVGVYLFKALFLAFLAWKQASFAFKVQAQLAERLFNLYIFQPYSFHLQRNSAQLIRNVTTEVNLFTFNGMLPGLQLVTEALVLIGLVSLLFFIEPIGALVAISVLGAVGWGFHRFTGKRLLHWGNARQYHDGLRIQHLQQGLGGAKDAKLLGRENEFLKQFRLHNAQSAKMGQLQSTLQQYPRFLLEVLAVSALAVLVISMLLQGRQLSTILPVLGLFAATAFRLMPSANRILGAMQMLRYGLPVVDLLYTESRLQSPQQLAPQEKANLTNGIELRGVGYAYPGAATPALAEVSLIINRGESVGFIGSSGAGKSTLVDIVLGLLSPSSGAVLVDDLDIQASLRSWQNQIGYVPQSIFLTDDTLRRNIAFGLPEKQIDDTALRRAIQAAQLEEFVGALPQGLETVVGERGIRLSGGQRQRIGIARALYHDPDVLVLDEATSALDTVTEQGVMQAITALHGRKTIIIVAHRLSTVEHCDRLYRLQSGRVIEEGAPVALVSSPARIDMMYSTKDNPMRNIRKPHAYP